MESLHGRPVAANGLKFHVLDEGSGDDVVVLLHGFPDTSHMWRKQIPALVEAGFRVIAPDLRGYGRSDKPEGVENYRMRLLVQDVDAIMSELDVERAHIVGHDWGAALAWTFAGALPGRTRSLTALAVGHPRAFQRAMLTTSQGLRSWYMGAFLIPGSERLLARNGFALFRRGLRTPDVDLVVEQMSEPGALTAALNWYRANIRPSRAGGPVNVTSPTMGIWGSRDPACGERQMRWSAEYVQGPFRFEEVDAGHWMMLSRADRVNDLLLDFLQPF